MSIIDQNIFEELKHSVGADFIGELIDTFLTDAPKLFTELHQALKDSNADAVRRTAHALKSNGASFGATEFVALAKELEMLGKAGTLEGAPNLLARLEAEYGPVANELKQLGKS